MPDIWLTSFTECIRIGHGSTCIGCRGGGMEDTEAVWMFHWCSSFFILFSSLWIGSQYSINGIGMGFATNQWRWLFSMRRTHEKVAIEVYQSVVGRRGSYDCVHRVIVSVLDPLSIFSSILASAAQGVCA